MKRSIASMQATVRPLRTAGLALAAVAALAVAAPASAGGNVTYSVGVGVAGPGYVGGAYYGGPRYYGPGYYGPRYYGPRYYGPGPYWGPRWYGPGYWGPGPYWYPPPVVYSYPPAVAVVPAQPPVYIERDDAAQPAPPASAPLEAGFWYYCRNPAGYYPNVRECPGGWEKVPPRPPGAQ